MNFSNRGYTSQGDFICCDENGVDTDQICHAGFTDAETKRAEELAAPFKSLRNTLDDNSESMYAAWMDKDGFIFKIVDDLTQIQRLQDCE